MSLFHCEWAGGRGIGYDMQRSCLEEQILRAVGGDVHPMFGAHTAFLVPHLLKVSDDTVGGVKNCSNLF